MPPRPPREPSQAKQLVFVNSNEQQSQQPHGSRGPSTSQEQATTTANASSSMTISDEKVDMEIIILGPKRGKRKSKTTSDSGSARDDDREAEKIGEQDPNEQAASPLNESLLKRLEKQYGQKRIVQADDNTYVDYMDYF